MSWYNIISKDISKIPDCILHYNNEYNAARKECGIWGNLEKSSAALPGIVEHRFRQLQEIEAILEYLNISAVDGILLDLGLSSFQLEDNSRGFSHKFESSLDMRFDCKSEDYTAEQIIKKHDLKELTKIFKDFGEERHAYKIAKKIKDLKGEINVMSITSIVDKVTPYKFRLKTYSRIFQALRIAANDELNHLDQFLDNFINLLNPGGRVVIISYHSVEDRIVKHKLKDLKHNKKIELIFKKPLTPSNEEVNMNKRARSAKMRVGEKIG